MDERSWLSALDSLRLECDGMTRVVSALLLRDGIAHVPMCGTLSVAGVGEIPVHHWIELEDGRLIDLRARMWLGEDPRVPHGVVPRDRANARYVGREVELSCTPVVFCALTDVTIDAFAPATFLMESASKEVHG
ncbi:hypothetical protein [Pseudorhodoferax aquiterrae]|nr:hypothetical protein [Pseudorhodoferax aquiterrae]